MWRWCWYAIRDSVKYEYYQIEVCVKVNARLLFIKSALTLHIDDIHISHYTVYSHFEYNYEIILL